MIHYFYLGILVALSFFLNGCQDKKPTYLYLMLHPQYLQREYNHCVEEVADPALPCETILHAQADFTNLINQREQEPEGFGARILQAQENSISLKRKFEATLQAYHTLGSSKPSTADLAKMRVILDQAQAEYEKSKEIVKILLAVIAATSLV